MFFQHEWAINGIIGWEIGVLCQTHSHPAHGDSERYVLGEKHL
jgi:hypothetical protein